MSTAPLPVVLDTDIGGNVDDALALALAVASPELDLLAVSVSYGDAEVLDTRARIAARLLGLAGRSDVTVLRGASANADHDDMRIRAIDDSVRALFDVPTPPHHRDAAVVDIPAVDWMVDAARRRPQELHVVGTGPFTTIAAALRADRRLASRLRGLTLMGGMVYPNRFPPYWLHGRGTAALDYNSQRDPGAALQCARSGVALTWVPIEVTLQTQLHTAGVARLRDEGAAMCTALARMVEVWGERWFAHRDRGQPDAVANLHDPLAMASLLPSSADWLTVEAAQLEYAIEDGGFITRPVPASSGRNTARVGTAVDADAFERFYLDRVVAAFGRR